MSYEDDDDDDGEEFDDAEVPDQADIGDEDSIDTDPCPSCGKPVYEDVELCPHCRNYISREDSFPPRKPVWFIVAAISTVVAIVVFWVIFDTVRN